jgi:hypothetical protein
MASLISVRLFNGLRFVAENINGTQLVALTFLFIEPYVNMDLIVSLGNVCLGVAVILD